MKKITSTLFITLMASKASALSDKGVNFLKNLEGFEPRTYSCSAGARTIGYGHRIKPRENIRQPISKSTATNLLTADANICQKAIKKHIKVSYQPCQMDAWISLFFNVGTGNVYNSRAKRPDTTIHYFNQRKKFKAADEFFSYRTAGGKFSNGIFKRRIAEVTVFLGYKDVDAAMRQVLTQNPSGYLSKCTRLTSDYAKYKRLAQESVKSYA